VRSMLDGQLPMPPREKPQESAAMTSLDPRKAENRL